MAVEREYFEQIKELEQANQQLKKQVERELKDNNGLRVTVGKYLNLKQQIQEYLDAEDVPDYGYPWHIAITKILKDG